MASTVLGVAPAASEARLVAALRDIGKQNRVTPSG